MRLSVAFGRMVGVSCSAAAVSSMAANQRACAGGSEAWRHLAQDAWQHLTPGRRDAQARPDFSKGHMRLLTALQADEATLSDRRAA